MGGITKVEAYRRGIDSQNKPFCDDLKRSVENQYIASMVKAEEELCKMMECMEALHERSDNGEYQGAVDHVKPRLERMAEALRGMATEYKKHRLSKTKIGHVMLKSVEGMYKGDK